MRYEITVKGHLDGRWSAWFDGLMITNRDNGDAVLAGQLVDQAALYGVLARIRDLGLPLLSVLPVGSPSNDENGGHDGAVPSSDS